MKKTTKILALVLAFTVVASMLVTVNVSAASTNLLTNPGFETGDTTSWYVHSRVQSNEVTAAAARTGNFGIEIVPKSNATVANQVLRGATMNVTEGEYYYLSAWLKAKDAVGDNKAFVRFQRTENTSLISNYSANAKALSTTDWTQLEGIAHVKTGGTGEAFMTAQLSTSTSNAAYSFYADDYELIKIAPQTTENIPLSGTIKVDGPQALNLSDSSVSLSGGTVSSVAYNTSDSTWDIQYSGLAGGSEYTLILDTAGMAEAADYPTFKLTTMKTGPSTENVLDDYNGSFEDAIATQSSTKTGFHDSTVNTTASEIWSQVTYDGTTVTVPAQDGVKYMKSTGRLKNGRWKLVYAPVEVGKTYVASVWLRLQSGESAATGKMLVENALTSRNTVGAGTPVYKNVSLSDSEWRKVSAIVTPVTATPTGTSGLGNFGVHIGFETSADVQVYVDNYELRELKTAGNFKMTASKDSSRVYLDITSTSETPVKIYYLAASYSGDAFVGAKLASASISSSQITSLELVNVSGDKLFIWDENFTPLWDSFDATQLY